VDESSPSLERERDMLVWFEYLEEQTSPPSVDGYSAEGLPETTGPNGEAVEFDVRYNPRPDEAVRGVIVIRRIRTQGPLS
jgi:hypothetical protein